jgi:hypothetical protein
MTKAGCYEDGDLFELMERGMRAKIRIMKIYPDMTSFIIKAFFEKDPEVSADIHKDYRRILNLKAASTLKNLDPEDFVPGLDLSMMYKEMFMASAGYLWEAVQHEGIDADKLERDFGEMIAFWKSLYCRKEGDA